MKFDTDDVVLFPFDVRVQKKSGQLADLLAKVLGEQGVSETKLSVDYDEVVDAAYKNSVKTDTDGFAEKLMAKKINVDVLGIYRSSPSRIRVRCRICSQNWSPRADTLLSGNSGCKKCGAIKNGKVHLKSHETFIA